MSERALLSAMIGSREAYSRVAPRLTEGDLSEQGKVILAGLTTYYDRDVEAKGADYELLAAEVARGLPNPKHKATFEQLIGEIGALGVSNENVVHDFLAVRREALGHKLASALAAGKGPDLTGPMVAEYQEWAQAEALDEANENEIVQGMSVVDLAEERAGRGTVELWPKVLNDKLDGGCLPGHHVIVFARPEVGKTLFLVNSIAGFLDQGLRVLYVGNEDPLSEIVLRVVCRLTGLTKYEVLKDPATADDLARQRGYDNLILAGMTPGTPREIEALITEYQPQVLLVDQIRNLDMNEEHPVQRLEKAATEMRNLTKRHRIVTLSVTQAGENAEGRAVLGMNHIDGSKTGIPGQCDLMVGVGATEEDKTINRRMLSLPKNKLSGKHEHFPVRIDPLISMMGAIK